MKRRIAFIGLALLLLFNSVNLFGYTTHSVCVDDNWPLVCPTPPRGAVNQTAWSCSGTNAQYVTVTKTSNYGVDVKVTHFFTGSATVQCIYYYYWYVGTRMYMSHATELYYITCRTSGCASSKGVQTVSVTPSEVNLTVGSTQLCNVSVTPSTATYVVSWNSSNTSVATVSSTGRVTAVGVGTTTINAVTTSSNGTKTGSMTVHVYQNPTSISLSPSSLTLNEGESQNLSVSYTPSNSSSTITWTSSNVSVATVSNGLVTAVSNGSATITATTTNGKKATCSVTVVGQPTAVSIPSNVNLKVGESYTLTPTLTPANSSTTYRWFSSNTSVATVSSSGVVQAVAAGYATVYCKTANYIMSNFCVVTVENVCYPPTSLTSQNVSATTARISWSEGGLESWWQYVYGEAGFTPDWNNATLTSSKYARLSRLKENTSYDFYVRSYESANNTSTPAKLTFRTSCASHSSVERYSICQGSRYYWHRRYCSSAGSYYDTLQTVSGCDSICILILTVNPKYYIAERYSICQGETYYWHGQTIANPGVYHDYLQTVNGCDSIFELTLTVNPTYFNSEKQYICQGESYSWHGQTLSVAGIYYDSLQTVNGCDSVYELTLAINPKYFVDEQQTICQGDSYSWHGQSLSVAGIYYDSLQTVNGCDSVYELTLTVNPKYFVVEQQTICQGDSYSWHGQSLSVAGIYYDSLQTVNGCDSIYKLTLAVNPTYFISENDTINQGETYYWHGRTIVSTGVYYDSLLTVDGCDSVCELTLSVTIPADLNYIYDVSDITLVPNPIKIGETSYIYAEFGIEDEAEMSIDILTPSGLIVRQIKVESFPIPVEGIVTSGTYFIRFITREGNVFVKKLIVQ